MKVRVLPQLPLRKQLIHSWVAELAYARVFTRNKSQLFAIKLKG